MQNLFLSATLGLLSPFTIASCLTGASGYTVEYETR
jgi:hypothetical protein